MKKKWLFQTIKKKPLKKIVIAIKTFLSVIVVSISLFSTDKNTCPTTFLVVSKKTERQYFFHIPIFTDVIVSEPATALSLNTLTDSFSSFSASAYSNGK